jgi:hypothetical protein
MKFAVLDARQHGDGNGHAKYTYLDDLLDKTFLTDYFLDRTVPSSASAASAASAAASVP